MQRKQNEKTKLRSPVDCTLTFIFEKGYKQFFFEEGINVKLHVQRAFTVKSIKKMIFINCYIDNFWKNSKNKINAECMYRKFQIKNEVLI